MSVTQTTNQLEFLSSRPIGKSNDEDVTALLNSTAQLHVFTWSAAEN